jgi:hypothetical protein
VNFADSSGHPDFIKVTEDDWITKKGDKDDQSLIQTEDAPEGKKEAATGDPRSMFYNGQKPFSEPETQAYRDFLTKHQDEVKFVINMHSNGNAFIWPFNGVQKNDIETRRPGIMNIF